MCRYAMGNIGYSRRSQSAMFGDNGQLFHLNVYLDSISQSNYAYSALKPWKNNSEPMWRIAHRTVDDEYVPKKKEKKDIDFYPEWRQILIKKEKDDAEEDRINGIVRHERSVKMIIKLTEYQYWKRPDAKMRYQDWLDREIYKRKK